MIYSILQFQKFVKLHFMVFEIQNLNRPNAPHNPIQTHGHQGKTEPGAAQAVVGYNYSLTSHV